MTEPKVSICIPAYRAEKFIDRTLNCARSQTHQNLEIIVSIDDCDEATAAVCERHAKDDARIRVVPQPEQMGWSGNANAALNEASSDYACIYFHDDIIEPAYIERLIAALNADDRAASAHCDLLEFGLVDHLRPAHHYGGNALHRLVDFMLTRRGTTLRSLFRVKRFDTPLRFPSIHGDNHWTAWVFHLRLLVPGPAVAVGETLYKRWQREGSLTRSKGWASEGMSAVLRGQAESLQECLAFFQRALTDPTELRVARNCLQLSHLAHVTNQRVRLGKTLDHPQWLPGSVMPEPPSGEGLLNEEAEGWIRTVHSQMLAREKALHAFHETSA
ncbi:MAG: glycosyltransferase family 2 protein [Lysobacterales bacterium]